MLNDETAASVARLLATIAGSTARRATIEPAPMTPIPIMTAATMGGDVWRAASLKVDEGSALIAGTMSGFKHCDDVA